MLSQSEEIDFLNKIGFTKAQARIYLTLLQTGKTTAIALQKQTKMPRPVVYRTLAELQKKALQQKKSANLTVTSQPQSIPHCKT